MYSIIEDSKLLNTINYQFLNNSQIYPIEIYSRIKRAKKRPRSPNPKSKSKNINSWFKKCKALK